MMEKTRNRKSGKILPKNRGGSVPPAMSIAIHTADVPEAEERRFTFRSPVMQSIYSIAMQVAGADAPVLIFGESGTGKELFARLLHTLSTRNAYPFVPVNCGVLHGELFVDKFFGHEAGAFTGAARLRKGAFEMAANGTLFLDEVGEIPAANQPDFLRVLEERCYRRMGGERDFPFQARLVAATNRPLEQMVRSGAFRADLFYRLNVVPVTLPPLRQRKEDIPLLALDMLEQFCHRYHRYTVTLPDATMEALVHYPWPGNVRELRNLLERLVLLTQTGPIVPESLPLEIQGSTGRGSGAFTPHEVASAEETDDLSLDHAVRTAEMKAIARALGHAGGHKEKAATMLEISPRSLRYKMAEYGLGKR